MYTCTHVMRQDRHHHAIILFFHRVASVTTICMVRYAFEAPFSASTLSFESSNIEEQA